uniref:Uncharacterized protein n=1 Tax=Arundo donax TaxID=35708 RepID=A0A0A9CAH7_ARUDO
MEYLVECNCSEAFTLYNQLSFAGFAQLYVSGCE